jgi:ADYC domain
LRLASIFALNLCAALVALSSDARSAPDHIQRIDVERTSLRVHLASGRVLQDKDLIGATLSLEMPGATDPQRVRIENVVADPTDSEGEMMLYQMKLLDVVGEAEELCDADPQGEHWVFPVQGKWDGQGKRISNDGFTLTCSSGAQGKCVRFGYKPWKTTKAGVRLEDYHQACIGMVTANYCGDHATTKDGMKIDLYDTIGINTRDESTNSGDLRFEAAWTSTGAACVAHTRVPDNITLDRLAATCPRLQDRVGESYCTEKKARSGELGAVLIFNRSR